MHTNVSPMIDRLIKTCSHKFKKRVAARIKFSPVRKKCCFGHTWSLKHFVSAKLCCNLYIKHSNNKRADNTAVGPTLRRRRRSGFWSWFACEKSTLTGNPHSSCRIPAWAPMWQYGWSQGSGPFLGLVWLRLLLLIMPLGRLFPGVKFFFLNKT